MQPDQINVVLTDGTVGKAVLPSAMDAADLVGLEVTVSLRDENGQPLQVQGVVSEIL